MESLFDGESLEQLPTDSNEPLAHMDLGLAQKMFKKSKKQPMPLPPSQPQTKPSTYASSFPAVPPVSLEVVQGMHDGQSSATVGLVHNLKITLIATVLFLILSHPKVDELIQRFRFDTFTAYAVKGTLFAIIFFVLKYKFV